MTLLQKLKDLGWYLTEEGLKKVTTSSNLETEDVKRITTAALDWDLKDIAAGALPAKLDNNGFITGRIVLQIQKMRNISAPKANEESTTAPRFLQLELSDGVNTIAALELERIASLNLNVPPGTKLYMKAEKLELLQGFLVLKASDIQVLGGKVEPMVEKWEVARQMLKYARSNIRVSGSGGPPPWIAFGKRSEAHKDDLPTDRNFKSLQAVTEKDKNSKENEEFNASRSQAIAEAAKAGQKKVFGGGQQNILDHNVKKILEKGFSEEDANMALKTTNNNLERALYNLKRRNNNRGGSIEINTKPMTISSGGRQRERGGPATAKDEAAAAKPQTNVSLFDFLTDKLPVSAPSANTTQTVTNNVSNERNYRDSSSKPYTNNSKATSFTGNRFENNMSSSFAANRYTPRSEDKQTMQPRSNFNQRHEERKSQPPIKAGRVGERSNASRLQQQTQNIDKPPTTSSSTNDNNTNPSTGSITNNNINTRKNERPPRKDREQTPRQSTTGYQGNKRNNDYKATENKPYQQRDSNNKANTETRNNSNNNQQTQQQQPAQKENNFEKALNNLVEKTSKISIQSKKESTYNNQQKRGGRNVQNARANQQQITTTIGQQQPASESYTNNTQQPQFVGSQNNSSKSQPMSRVLQATVPSPQPVGLAAQLGNGFAYDPSKIMGFQSKEANEYAMNLLKSQGLTLQQFQQQQQQQQQATPLQQSQVPSLPPPAQQKQQHHPQAQILNTQAAPPAMAYMAQNPNLFVASPQQVPPQFGMMTGGNWPWKMGDLCLAKYWDDGNYYDAKITAISEKTCVVFFLGYGNHEEVLKSDCLPITDAQHIPLNAYQANIAGPPMPPPTFQQRGNPASSVGGVNQRYRGERQMYVPPPKRGNN